MPISVTVRALHANIITSNCDAIVNVANSSLFSGNDVDSVIHRAAGPELLETCRALHDCRIGEVKLASGFHLPTYYIVHTVGPIWHGDRQNEAALLAACYRNNPELAHKHEVHSIVSPYISTSVYGFPPQLATSTAVRTTREYGAGLDTITFCRFSVIHLALYEAALTGSK